VLLSPKLPNALPDDPVSLAKCRCFCFLYGLSFSQSAIVNRIPHFSPLRTFVFRDVFWYVLIFEVRHGNTLLL
jgi:hypothetical protein